MPRPRLSPLKSLPPVAVLEKKEKTSRAPIKERKTRQPRQRLTDLVETDSIGRRKPKTEEIVRLENLSYPDQIAYFLSQKCKSAKRDLQQKCFFNGCVISEGDLHRAGKAWYRKACEDCLQGKSKSEVPPRIPQAENTRIGSLPAIPPMTDTPQKEEWMSTAEKRMESIEQKFALIMEKLSAPQEIVVQTQPHAVHGTTAQQDNFENDLKYQLGLAHGYNQAFRQFLEGGILVGWNQRTQTKFSVPLGITPADLE